MFYVADSVQLIDKLRFNYQASNIVGVNDEGDVLLRHESYPYTMHLYRKQGLKYKEVWAKNPPGNKRYRIAITQEHIFGQEMQESYEKPIRISLRDPQQQSCTVNQQIENQPRRLIGCLPPDSSVYVCNYSIVDESPRASRTYHISIVNPQGGERTLHSKYLRWTGQNLSICSTSKYIIVVSGDDKCLDKFTHVGEVVLYDMDMMSCHHNLCFTFFDSSELVYFHGLLLKKIPKICNIISEKHLT